MKKTLKSIPMLAAVSMALAAVSCTKEGTPSAAQENGISTITLSIEQPTAEDATKTALGGKSGEYYPINWSAGDSIAVSGQSAAEFKKYTLQSGDGTQSGTFFGESIEGAVYAYYPYANVTGVSTQTYTVTIPDEQQYVAGSFGNGAMPMYAKADAAGSLQSMKPLMSVLKISLTGSCKVHSIFLQSASVALSGSAVADMEAGVLTIDPTTGKKYVLLTCGEGVQLSGTATTFHIVVPATAAAVTDFTVTIKDDKGYTMKKSLSTTSKFTAKVIKNVSSALAVSTSFSLLPGKFSKDASNKIQFSNGNLQATVDAPGKPTAWNFAADQYGYIGNAVANNSIGTTAGVVDLFGWSTSETTYGISTSKKSSDYSGDFVDWGANAIANGGNTANQWSTLSSAEWTYLLNTRSGDKAPEIGTQTDARYAEVKVNGVRGLLIFPDTFTWPEGISTSKPATFNTFPSAKDWNSVNYTAAEFILLGSAGCVFLPAAGSRYGSGVYDIDSLGDYWSSAPDEAKEAYSLEFGSGGVDPACDNYREMGYSVRLVCAAQ